MINGVLTEDKKFIEYSVKSSDGKNYVVAIEVEYADREGFEILKSEFDYEDEQAPERRNSPRIELGYDESLKSMVLVFPEETVDVVAQIKELQDMDPTECIYLYEVSEGGERTEILPDYLLDYEGDESDEEDGEPTDPATEEKKGE